MRVEQITYQATKEWLLYKHYAHRIPSISYAFGLYDDTVLVGVCTFGVPASYTLVRGAFGGEYVDCFLELNRLVVNDGLKKNSLSWFVSRCLKMLPRPMVVVSYADSGMGHHGYIYQATNWVYTGMSAERRDSEVGNDNKHRRHLFDDYGGIKEAKKQGVKVEMKERSRKYRYFYFLGSKREKRQMRSRLCYGEEKYPKGENRRYDTSYTPTVQLPLFID